MKTDDRLRNLERRMRLHLEELVRSGCPICDANGGKGYTNFPLTGKVCNHMIKKREEQFGKEIDSFVLGLVELFPEVRHGSLPKIE